MAKKSSAPRRRTAGAGDDAPRVPAGDYQLVIVESPAKAKTIEKYLGSGFVVKASIGHIRDLPSKAPKGSKQPVPGVDLDHDFAPTYEIDSDKTRTVTELRKLAKGASDVWFATDLDPHRPVGRHPQPARRGLLEGAGDERRKRPRPSARDVDRLDGVAGGGIGAADEADDVAAAPLGRFVGLAHDLDRRQPGRLGGGPRFAGDVDVVGVLGLDLHRLAADLDQVAG